MRKYWEDIETNTGRVILIKSLSAELEWGGPWSSLHRSNLEELGPRPQGEY